MIRNLAAFWLDVLAALTDHRRTRWARLTGDDE